MKTVLISGCSQGGIGDALAQEFHRRGLRVFASVRSPSKAEHLRQIGVEVIILDISSETSILKAVEEIGRRTAGKLDFLVNNAITGTASCYSSILQY